MELLNAVLAALDKMGLEYLVLEFGGLILLIFVFFGIRKIVKLQKINLTNLDKYYTNICKKIDDDHKITDKLIKDNHDEIDPGHLYSKINKFEDDLSRHQHEEVRQLHDVHNKVIQIDARLESVKICREKD
jgi:hypothetical protein